MLGYRAGLLEGAEALGADEFGQEFADAFARVLHELVEHLLALEALTAGRGTADSRQAIAPFLHGRWDDAARAHDAADEAQKNAEATAAYAGEGAFDPGTTREALAGLGAPVLLLTGGLDVSLPQCAAAEYAALFPHARLLAQPGAGHAPWLDDPGRFIAATTQFLTAAQAGNPA
ncbi:alpha/beta hydrolase [Streptomyces sp. NPDC001193]